MISVVKHALMITGFVAVMMLVIEYLNVLSRGKWQEWISKRPWGQYLLAAFLGAVPGYLGAFAAPFGNDWNTYRPQRAGKLERHRPSTLKPYPCPPTLEPVPFEKKPCLQG